MTARKFVPAIPASQSRTDAGPYGNPFAEFHRGVDRLLAEIARPSFMFRDADSAAERDAAADDAAEDARMAAATERQTQIDADELAGARDAASWFPTYRGV